MRYYVSLDPASGTGTGTGTEAHLAIDLKELPSGALEVRIGDRLVDVDVVDVGGQLSIRIDGKVVDLTVEGTPPEIGAIASGHRSYVRVESERQRAADAAKKGTSGGGDRVLKSPMPGRVVKVLVQAGDVITAGQPLIVIEAMKMENELKAKAAGTVSEVHVQAGAAVEGSAKLISFA